MKPIVLPVANVVAFALTGAAALVRPRVSSPSIRPRDPLAVPMLLLEDMS